MAHFITCSEFRFVYIIRYSEIALKGPRARSQMESRLISNLKASLVSRGVDFSFSKEPGRIFLDSNGSAAEVEDAVSRVFGVKSISEAVSIEFTSKAEIIGKAVELFSEGVRGKKFAVRVRRSGSHTFTSRDLEEQIGNELFQISAGVDLVRPDFTCYLEVRNNRCFFYSSIHSGPGGLPLGSEGKLVSLMSGGIDSPVAAWMMLRRGCPVDAIFLALAHPVDTSQFLNQFLKLYDNWYFGYNPTVYVVDGTEAVERLTDGKSFRFPNVTFKKILYRLAEKIAEKEHFYGIVTGESMGQVSSQTAENLFALSRSVHHNILRPLVGMDKDEITETCRRIGTFPESSLGEFCALFSAEPITKISLDDLESEIVPDELLVKMLEKSVALKGSQIREFLAGIEARDTRLSEPRGGETVIDLRRKEDYRAWHFPGAINVRLPDLKSMGDLLRNPRGVILYCSKGLQSAAGAAILSQMGIEARYTSTEYLKKKADSPQVTDSL